MQMQAGSIDTLAPRAAIAALAERILDAAAARRPLVIRGGGSKDFFGNPATGERLETHTLQAPPRHEPAELVVTVAAGTPLAELEALLAGAGQMLAFEPPHFGAAATVGGAVAAGLCGPRRIAAGHAGGALRDQVLGAKLLDGRGQLLAFGGTVIKNVAGYDVARVLAGSLGVLGVLVEVSLRVVPRPAAECSVMLECNADEALRRFGELGLQPWPVSASAWFDGRLWLRLSGAIAAVQQARRALGGELLDAEAAADFWMRLREHRHEFFELASDQSLWRLALPAGSPVFAETPCLLEWHGMQRWLKWPPVDDGGGAATTVGAAAPLRSWAGGQGGHATRFRGEAFGDPVFAPLAPAVLEIHRRLKREFDPAGVFNRGRLQPAIDEPCSGQSS